MGSDWSDITIGIHDIGVGQWVADKNGSALFKWNTQESEGDDEQSKSR